MHDAFVGQRRQRPRAFGYDALMFLRSRLTLALCLGSGLAAADPLAIQGHAVQEATPIEFRSDPETEKHSRLFLRTGLLNVYPKLESERQLTRFFNASMGGLAPGFEPVTGVAQTRDDGTLVQPRLGLGYVLSDHWTFTVQAGASQRKIRHRGLNPSLFAGLPLHTDFESRIASRFIGAGIDVYPMGIPERRPYETWSERFKAARPYAGVGGTALQSVFRTRISVAVLPFPNVGIRYRRTSVVYSWNLRGGVELPINARNSLVFGAGYNRFNRQREDFDGMFISIDWQRSLPWPGKN